MENRSLNRYIRKHGDTEYICLTCINQTNGQRALSIEERKQRSERARKLWRDPDYRIKVVEAIKDATSTTEFSKKVSNNNKLRGR